MNTSIVKLEDFELDEISGGINIDKEKAKKIAKKIAGYLIKGLCTATFATADRATWIAIDGSRNSLLDVFVKVSSLIALPFLSVASWKLGELICEKIGFKD